MEALGVADELVHRFGDEMVAMGGIRTLGLESDSLDIRAAVSKVAQSMMPSQTFSLYGITVVNPIAAILAPLMLVGLQIVLLFHCVKISRLSRLSRKLSCKDALLFPWIPLYDGVLALLFNIITSAAFPALLASMLVWQGLRTDVLPLYAAIGAVSVFGLSIWIGLLTVKAVWAVRNSWLVNK